MDITTLTLNELSKALSEKKISSVEATKAYLKRIEDVEPKVAAFMTVTREEALKQAEAADKRIKDGSLTPLTGVPVALKDIFCTKGIETTCSSKILKGFIPPYDATVVEKLKAAGAVILGKLNMDEFAMGSSTENSAYKQTKNPWDTSRVPGGSSGGSAASVAANECAFSLGTDTGGSIRQPASLCGVIGLKPTYGRVSRYGMIAFASSLDQAGPLTKDVLDSAIVLNAIAGYDKRDSTSIKSDVPDYTEGIDASIKGLKIGIPKEYFVKGLDKEVEASITNAIDFYKKSGTEIVDITLPHTEYAVSVYYVIATAEASSNLARYDGVRYGQREKTEGGLVDMYRKTRDAHFGKEVKRRIMLGTYVLSAGYYDAYYKKAEDVRTLITSDFTEAFKKCDVILTPTSPTAAFKFGEKTEDPLTMYLSDIFTISCNLAGIPGISVPSGLTNDNLPIGLQLLGKHLDEKTILKAAYAFEKEAGFKGKRPKL
ncbi:MAG: Asp-tRNA(Asn)/Glu-tRNA(Gln) amidotransferase subunit GatA [Deltaproteobacteria bacterium]|nr:Asp-tRNA(Asn)/Glu-tRNA(Gln) amidotransferase subunit GatA [Deltaproteobacteria bacterium]